jgi:DNA polymerase III subunit beta
MKLKVNKEALLDILQKVQSVVSPRATLPVLSNVLLKAENGQLTVTATDLELSVQTRTSAEIVKEGATTLPARRIFSIVREIPSAEVEFDVDEKNVASITAGSSHFKLNGMSDEEFPPLPKLDGGHVYGLDQPVFREMLQKTAYAASTDETRYILNGVLMSFAENKLTMVATDGRRLALIDQELEYPKDAERDLVLPTKTVHELIRTLEDEGALKIRAAANQIAFDFGEMLVISKLIDGTYPNYRQVIPSGADVRIAIEREGFLAAIRRAALLTTDQSNSVKMSFSKNTLEIVTQTPDVGESRETLPIKYDEKELSVAFNPAFMMDPLKILQCDEIFFELTDELSPGVIKADLPFLYVIMPMRVS